MKIVLFGIYIVRLRNGYSIFQLNIHMYIMYIKIKSYTLAKQYIAKSIAFEILSALAMTLSLAPCAFTSGHTISYRSLFRYCAYCVLIFCFFLYIFSFMKTHCLTAPPTYDFICSDSFL